MSKAETSTFIGRPLTAAIAQNYNFADSFFVDYSWTNP
jgi:hypothetical protein